MPRTSDARFARAVREGLCGAGRKRLEPEFFYDRIGSALFEVITLLPEYGLTRADRRLLSGCADAIAARLPQTCSVIELGSGSGTKTAHILNAIARRQDRAEYYAVDVSRAALDCCRLELSGSANVHTLEAGFLDGVAEALRSVPPHHHVLILFLGSTVGNFDRSAAVQFLRSLRALLSPGDMLLIGADLVKPVDCLLLAYDDPAGVTAAFNLNLLARMNRELGADFNLRRFTHVVRYDEAESRIEMHLQAADAHSVNIAGAGCVAHFEAGETVWTESSHKYTRKSLDELAESGGFRVIETWTDDEWPFVESIWEARPC